MSSTATCPPPPRHTPRPPAAPLLPLRILRSRTLVGANAAMLVFSTIGYGMPFILTLYAQQVLGFSPVEFGLSSAVFPLTVAVAAITGQGLVLKIGFRPIAAAGFILLAGGSLYLAQVSPDGSYFGDIFLGLLLSGLGTGFAFVTLSIAALTGVEEREAGLASGLNNTTFQIGAAIVSTVAVSRTDDLLAAGGDRLVALTEGFQSAFLACIVLAGVGLLFALLLPGRAPRPALEVLPEPVADEA